MKILVLIGSKILWLLDLLKKFLTTPAVYNWGVALGTITLAYWTRKTLQEGKIPELYVSLERIYKSKPGGRQYGQEGVKVQYFYLILEAFHYLLTPLNLQATNQIKALIYTF